ncbi:MAG: hypothetical protein F6K39_24910 [Okeania sp. SIO3B3]|nr:hypothetical protein [Okeania sp. SIO3B3]
MMYKVNGENLVVRASCPRWVYFIESQSAVSETGKYQERENIRNRQDAHSTKLLKSSRIYATPEI